MCEKDIVITICGAALAVIAFIAILSDETNWRDRRNRKGMIWNGR